MAIEGRSIIDPEISGTEYKDEVFPAMPWVKPQFQKGRVDWVFAGICGTGYLRDGYLRDGRNNPLEKFRRHARRSVLLGRIKLDVQLTAKRKRSLTLSRLGLSLRSALLQSKAPLRLPLDCAHKVRRP